MRRSLLDRYQRHWRLIQALAAHRVERRLGRHLTDAEVERLNLRYDPLALRSLWLASGGWLEARDGRLCLSEGLRRRHAHR